MSDASLMSDKTSVVLYSTSVPTLPKVRADIATIKRILEAKRVEYEEIDLSTQPGKRGDMLAGSDHNTRLPQLHVNGQFLGDADVVQELEDFGQLDAALTGQLITH